MASKEQLLIDHPPLCHSTPNSSPKKFETENEECHERKSLHVIQPSALDDNTMVRSMNPPHKPKKKIKPIPGHVIVFEDTVLQRTTDSVPQRTIDTDCKSTQTCDSLFEDLIEEHVNKRSKRDHSQQENGEEEAFEMMVKEPVPESYWKEIAEQRRLALSDTLEENKSLHEQVESLQKECEALYHMASAAQSIQDLFQFVEEEDQAEATSEKQDQDHRMTSAGSCEPAEAGTSLGKLTEQSKSAKESENNAISENEDTELVRSNEKDSDEIPFWLV